MLQITQTLVCLLFNDKILSSYYHATIASNIRPNGCQAVRRFCVETQT